SLKNGGLNTRLADVYGQDNVAREVSRYIKAIEVFNEKYGVSEISIFSAPGRSEIGGNHTDHQHGAVLAAAINLDAIAIVSFNDSNIIDLTSDMLAIKPVDISVSEVIDEEAGTSEALIRGVASRMRELGCTIKGFNAYVTSTVLGGSGLSSSAAFEVLIGTIISLGLNEGKIDAVEIAKVGQYAENVYFKKPCGLMDQMASSVGGFVGIDFLSTEKPIVEKVNFDFASTNFNLCIVDTKGSHANLTNEYAAIPNEMRSIANYYGKDYLVEVDENQFYDDLGVLYANEDISDRAIVRALHFFNETKRAKEEKEALQQKDFNKFLNIVQQSGNSSYKYLQNVFAASDVVNQGVSVGIAASERLLGDKGVVRVHGGGFAGTIQAFVPDCLLEDYKTMISNLFGDDACYVLKIRSYGGIEVIGK
ncbi:MAG: galactokinase family protein, partial [Erysipelotrichaceae bacterium]